MGIQSLNQCERINSLTDFGFSCPPIELNVSSFFHQSNQIPVPSLNVFFADINSNSEEYKNLPTKFHNPLRIINMCFLPPSVTVLVMENPDLFLLDLLHGLINHLFSIIPIDTPIILDETEIQVAENEALPDGEYYDSSFAQPFFPSILSLLYFWKRTTLENYIDILVPRSLSPKSTDQIWCTNQHEMMILKPVQLPPDSKNQEGLGDATSDAILKLATVFEQDHLERFKLSELDSPEKKWNKLNEILRQTCLLACTLDGTATVSTPHQSLLCIIN